MKNLVLGFLPLLVFWIFEEYFGTLGGIVAATIWSLGEISYEWIRFHKIQKLTLFSGALVVGLGALDLVSGEGSRLFLFQPIILQVFFIGMILFGLRGDPPRILSLLGEKSPVLSSEPSVRWAQIQLMRGMLLRMALVMGIHAAGLVYGALNLTTTQFVFLKGPGLLIVLGFWAGGEFLKTYLVGRRLRRDTTKMYGAPLGSHSPSSKEDPS